MKSIDTTRELQVKIGGSAANVTIWNGTWSDKIIEINSRNSFLRRKAGLNPLTDTDTRAASYNWWQHSKSYHMEWNME